MPIIHEVTGTVDGAEQTVHVLYAPISGSCEFPDGFNVFQPLHDAALQYVLSRQESGEDISSMTYMDVVLNVPQECCAAKGIYKWVIESSAQPANGNRFLVSQYDVAWNKKRDELEQRKKAAFSGVFCEFAARLGALRLEKSAISDWTIPQIAQQVCLWSQEYVENAENLNGCLAYPDDAEEFVNEKLELLKNSRNWDPPEVKPLKKQGKRTKK